MAAPRHKRIPHQLPSRTANPSGSREPSATGIPKWPTRKPAIHHHPIPRRHHIPFLPLQNLAPPPPSAPYPLDSQPLPVPSHSRPLWRPPRSLCPIRDPTEPSRAFGKSHSQNLPRGRGPSHHQHPTHRPQHWTFHPSRWSPNRGDRQWPHLVGWHPARDRHNPGLTPDPRRATTQTRRAIYWGSVAGRKEEERKNLPGAHPESPLPTRGAWNRNRRTMEWRSLHVC